MSLVEIITFFYKRVKMRIVKNLIISTRDTRDREYLKTHMGR